MCRHISPLITSCSSCTSSIVGHGSAICASGIFYAGFLPPSLVKCGAPGLFCLSFPLSFFPTLLSSAPPSLGSKVRVHKIVSALGSDVEDAQRELGRQQTIVIPPRIGGRFWATCFLGERVFWRDCPSGNSRNSQQTARPSRYARWTLRSWL